MLFSWGVAFTARFLFFRSHHSLVLDSVAPRLGQDRIYTPYITVYCVLSLPKITYIHCTYMVLANPSQTTIFDFLTPQSSA